MTHRSQGHQFLAGLFADQPDRVGWVLLGYSLVFGTGVTGWSTVLPRISAQRALRERGMKAEFRSEDAQMTAELPR